MMDCLFFYWTLHDKCVESMAMRLEYYTSDEGESLIGLWIPRLNQWIDVSAKEDDLWDAMLEESAHGRRLRREIERWMDQGAPRGVEFDKEGLVPSSALHVLPGTIVCLGKTYAAHAQEFDASTVDEPAIFLKSVSAISQDLGVVLCPEGSQKLDYEVELAVMLRATLKNASVDEASQAILGYTLMCDYSERSYQLERGGQWTKGKSYDSFAPFGPCLVTADEIEDENNVALQLKVNGELRQNGNTRDLIASVAKLVSYVSQFMTLNPGDIVSTGTPAGVGMGMNPPSYLKVGDVVEWGSDAIGWVKQTVVEDRSFSG